MSAEVAAQPVPGQDELLDREALQPDRRPRAPLRPAPPRSCCSARRARGSASPPASARPSRTRRASCAQPTGRWRPRPRPGRPPRRDHRPGRPQDGDQRAQLRRARLHGRLEDALSPTWAQRRRRARDPARRARRTLEFTTPEGKRYPLGDDARDAPRAAARLAPRRSATCSSTGARCRRACSTSRSTCATAATRRARQRAVLLPAEAREPPRGRALERRLRRRAGGRRPAARHDPRDGPDRDDPGAFEMEEILYELREHAAGLNAGRWDYIFSVIKKFRDDRRSSCPTAPR